MKRFLRRPFGTTPAAPTAKQSAPVEHEPGAASDYLVLVQIQAGADPVPMTLGELQECDTLEKLLRRAAEKTEASGTAPATGRRPNPADFRGRPIGDHLKALGVPEDTSRYEKEQDVRWRG